jgi:hypothetical protein
MARRSKKNTEKNNELPLTPTIVSDNASNNDNFVNDTNATITTPTFEGSKIISLRSKDINTEEQPNAKKPRLQSVTVTKKSLFLSDSVNETENNVNQQSLSTIHEHDSKPHDKSDAISVNQQKEEEYTDDDRSSEDEMDALFDDGKPNDNNKLSGKIENCNQNELNDNNNISVSVSDANLSSEITSTQKVDQSELLVEPKEVQLTGKEEMIKYVTDKEKNALRLYVRNVIFQKIKFLGQEKLGENSSIIDELFQQLHISDKETKNRKFMGVRYILQRQLNAKRSYCTNKIMNACLGMLVGCC